MPQTLLALLAVVIATTFAISQTQAVTHQDMQVVAMEVQTQAVGLASEWLDEAAARSLAGGFDEVTGLALTAAEVVPAALLTPAARFGPDGQALGAELTAAAFDDIDDYHGLSAYVLRQVTPPEGGAPVRVRYHVTARVQYVTDTDAAGQPLGQLRPAAAPTYRKLVEFTVTYAGTDAGEGGLQLPPVTLSRVFSYPA